MSTSPVLKWIRGGFPRYVAVGLGLATVSSACSLALWRGGALERVEYPTWSWRVKAFSRHAAPSDRVALILVDQESLDWGKREMGLSWPWPREAYARVLDFCRRGGASAVAVDVLFTEPSFYGVDDDRALGDAMARGGNVVAAVFAGRSGDAETWPAGASTRLVTTEGLAHAPSAARAPRATFPVAPVAAAAAPGDVAGDPDADGAVRRMLPYRIFDERAVPSLGLAAVLLARSSDGLAEDWSILPHALRIGRDRLPLGRDGRLILRFKGHDGRHMSYGADAVIRSSLLLEQGLPPEVAPTAFSNACVFIGLSAPGLMDVRSTPVSRVLPGTELHATLADNLLAGDPLRDASPAAVAALTLLLASLAATGGMWARSGRQGAAVFALTVPAPVALAFAAYGAGFWWPMVCTELAATAAWVAASLINFATEGRQRLFLKHAFRQYLGAEVIDRILSDPSSLRLGGDRRVLTIFFSDIEGFSSLSERLSPEALTAFLNEYLSAMGDIIKDEGGYVDKYIGDAIVAFWNAPLAQSDHAVRACRTAVRCQRMLTERKAEFAAAAGGVVRMRIGLHTGEVVVGNMGSRARFNYTILGDAANLASRLEGANKVFGTAIMASDETWRLTRGEFTGRPLARLRVVGRQAPVDVHELRGLACDTPQEDWSDFAAGRLLFGEARFAEAAACFERRADDVASRAYARRCEAWRAAAPSNWDGVWELTGK